jgi:hypothetical protein
MYRTVRQMNRRLSEHVMDRRRNSVQALFTQHRVLGASQKWKLLLYVLHESRNETLCSTPVRVCPSPCGCAQQTNMPSGLFF